MANKLDVAYYLRAALDWIDAVPSDTQLPAMPGFERDEAENVLAEHKEVLKTMTTEAQMREQFEKNYGIQSGLSLNRNQDGEYYQQGIEDTWRGYRCATEQMKPLVDVARELHVMLKAAKHGHYLNTAYKPLLERLDQALASIEQQEKKNG